MADKEEKQWFQKDGEKNGSKVRGSAHAKNGGNKPLKSGAGNTGNPSVKKFKKKPSGKGGHNNNPSAVKGRNPGNADRSGKDRGNTVTPPASHSDKAVSGNHEIKAAKGNDRNTASLKRHGKKKKRYFASKNAKEALRNKQVKEEKKNETVSIQAPARKEPVIKAKSNTKARKNARKRALKMVPVIVAVIAIAIVVLYFVIFHLFRYFAVKPEFAFISDGSVEHTIGARALFVRSETIVPATAEGDLVTQATEGSRVAKDQDIAMIVPANMETVVTSLRNTQSQISEVQQELIRNGNADGADVIYNNISERIEPIVDMFRLDAINGKMSDISSYSSSIYVLINQREQDLSELDFDDERLRVLRSDEAGYESQLQRSASIVRATSPGIISFRLDGHEDELNFKKFLDMSPADVKNILENSEGIITSDLYVEKNEGLARIASNEKQYIAVFLDADKTSLDAFAVGTKHTLNIGSEGISIRKCNVERIEMTGDEVLIVFSTSRYVEDLLDLRSADIEIVITESTGLRVPISSLVSPDYDRGIASLYYNNKGFVDEVSILIVDYDREFAIVSPIGDATLPNHQTVIITNPKSVKPGDKVG